MTMNIINFTTMSLPKIILTVLNYLLQKDIWPNSIKQANSISEEQLHIHLCEF